jgi:hypothetical protein
MYFSIPGWRQEISLPMGGNSNPRRMRWGGEARIVNAEEKSDDGYDKGFTGR